MKHALYLLIALMLAPLSALHAADAKSAKPNIIFLLAEGGFADRVTITELLHKNGYATGHFGKWHIGPDDQSKPGTYGIDVISSGAGGAKKKNTAGRDAPIYDEAIKFIEQHKEGPFYMNVWGHVSHHKVDPPQSYIDLFKDLTVDESKFAEPMHLSRWQARHVRRGRPSALDRALAGPCARESRGR